MYDETIFASPELHDVQRVVLHAERLVPVAARIRGHLAKITRRTVVERRTFDVHIAHEELVVTYETGDGTEMPEGAPESWRVLLHAEEIVVTKQVRGVGGRALDATGNGDARFDELRRHEELEVRPDP